MLPFLRVFSAWGVRPAGLSACGILCVALVPFAIERSPELLAILFILNIFFDAMDGALARYLRISSARGAYLDLVASQSTLIVTMLTLQWFGYEEPFWLLLYGMAYLLLMTHYVLMSARGTNPPFPVFRTNALFYLFVVLHRFGALDIDTFELGVRTLGIYYSATLLIYVVLFRWSLTMKELLPPKMR